MNPLLTLETSCPTALLFLLEGGTAVTRTKVDPGEDRSHAWASSCACLGVGKQPCQLAVNEQMKQNSEIGQIDIETVDSIGGSDGTIISRVSLRNDP